MLDHLPDVYKRQPQGSAAERLANIRAEGAQAEITDMNYDDTVRYTSELAQKNGWIIVQDTAWDGYTRIPLWIMQGYMTMALEAYEQLPVKPCLLYTSGSHCRVLLLWPAAVKDRGCGF